MIDLEKEHRDAVSMARSARINQSLADKIRRDYEYANERAHHAFRLGFIIGFVAGVTGVLGAIYLL